jgi:hypothetical protein
MSAVETQMKSETSYFASQERFTACAMVTLLLKTDVDFFKNSGFASGFFEGKPRGKQINKNTSDTN